MFTPNIQMDISVWLLTTSAMVHDHPKKIEVKLTGVMALAHGRLWKYHVLHHVKANRRCQHRSTGLEFHFFRALPFGIGGLAEIKGTNAKREGINAISVPKLWALMPSKFFLKCSL